MPPDLSYPLGYGLSKTGLLLIPAIVGKYALCFIIDTGATVSLIDRDIANRLKAPLIKNQNDKVIMSIDGTKQHENSSATLSLTLENHVFSHTFVCKSLFEALSQLEIESKIPIHGILGNDFLTANKWIIDFKNLELRNGH